MELNLFILLILQLFINKLMKKKNEEEKKLYYNSAEFLIGKLLTNNLINF